MKSMKKMLCLLLVAMLLVSAIPFSVAADTTTDAGTLKSYPIVYRIHFVGEYVPVPVTIDDLPSDVQVLALTNDPDPSAIRSAALERCSAANAKTFISQLGFAEHGRQAIDYTLGDIEVTFESGTVYYTLSVTKNPETTDRYTVVDATILEKVGSTYVSNGKTIPVDILERTTQNPVRTTVTVTQWKTGAQIKEKYAAAFDGKTVNVDDRYVNDNVPYICISTSTSSSSSGGESLGGGSSNNGGSSSNNGGSGSNNGGSGSNNGGTGTVAQFKVTFLNVNGVEFYSEYVTANGTIAASASFLNSSVGTKAGHEHIGWKAGNSNTKSTDVVLTDRINSNITYVPQFKNLTNNSTWAPGNGSSSGSSGTSSGDNLSKGNTNRVLLHVFLNGDTSALYKTYDITDQAVDMKHVTYDWVYTYLRQYYNAKNNAGLKLDGLYYVTGNWVGDYFNDNYTKDITDIISKLNRDGYVHINVMLNNATAKTASTADKTNPKTGDTIFVPFMVMGLTATALAAAYVFGKKRIAR